MSNEHIRYRRLGYLALNVTDLDQSSEFYERIVGLTPAGKAGGCRFFRCSEKHHDIALVQADEPGIKRIGWEMESPEALAAVRSRFAKLGLNPTPVSNSEAELLGIGEAFRASDPVLGATMEFYAAMDKAKAPYVPSHTRIVRLGHVVLAGPDLPRAEDFFIKEMNFRASDRIDGAVVHMRCFPNPLHHSFGIGRAEAPQLHHVNFMVTDVDDIGRANVRMKKENVPIVYGPGKHPQSESLFFYFLDPDGITLEYSFGMEEFPETGAREPRLFPLELESVDHWGGGT
ncbi:VOC family protein [Henriciella aquimarina]|uniref:VOC family protein n=1 Tax=Henriciella aquimarina TaxID=545261 RepID=UPI001F4412E0|nr:VOC family protein [Henriciella aquimarina]